MNHNTYNEMSLSNTGEHSNDSSSHMKEAHRDSNEYRQLDTKEKPL